MNYVFTRKLIQQFISSGNIGWSINNCLLQNKKSNFIRYNQRSKAGLH